MLSESCSVLAESVALSAITEKKRVALIFELNLHESDHHRWKSVGFELHDGYTGHYFLDFPGASSKHHDQPLHGSAVKLTNCLGWQVDFLQW